MIQIVLLSGFLGAGKTTLLKSILDMFQDKRIGVIINEFGKINVDAKLVCRDGIELAELTNGSIFCSCIKDKFVDCLISFADLEIEYLFIEASGLADPANMPEILKGIRLKTGDSYLYRGALCVVDGENYSELRDLLPALERQVEYSDVLIINKADLVGEEIIKKVWTQVAEINPMAPVYVTSHCRVDIRGIVESMMSLEKAAAETTNTFETRPSTVVLTAEEMLLKEELENFLKEMVPYTYRIKGFSETDKGSVEISTVVNNIYLSDWRTNVKGSEIVVISSVGIRILSLITAALERRMKGKLHL